MKINIMVMFGLFCFLFFIWGESENENLNWVNATLSKMDDSIYILTVNFNPNKKSQGYMEMLNNHTGRVHAEVFACINDQGSEEKYINCGSVNVESTGDFSDEFLKIQIPKVILPWNFCHLRVKVYANLGGFKSNPIWVYAGVAKK